MQGTFPEGSGWRAPVKGSLLLLPKTEQHLYYWVNEKAGEIVVMTIWGARRGRPPKL